MIHHLTALSDVFRIGNNLLYR